MKSCFYETETHIYDTLFSFSRKMEIFLNHIGLKHQLEIFNKRRQYSANSGTNEQCQSKTMNVYNYIIIYNIVLNMYMKIVHCFLSIINFFVNKQCTLVIFHN